MGKLAVISGLLKHTRVMELLLSRLSRYSCDEPFHFFCGRLKHIRPRRGIQSVIGRVGQRVLTHTFCILSYDLIYAI